MQMRLTILLRLFVVCLFVVESWSLPSESLAQSPGSAPSDAKLIAELAEAAKSAKPNAESTPPAMDLMSLLVKGGVFMIPIGLISLIAAAFAIERLIGLRSGKLLPSKFSKKMVGMIREAESIDPRVAYPVCLDTPRRHPML